MSVPPAVFEEPEDPSNRSFFSEIISSISDVKFSHNGRYMMTRDYLSVKIWDLNMETRPVETFQVRLVDGVWGVPGGTGRGGVGTYQVGLAEGVCVRV